MRPGLALLFGKIIDEADYAIPGALIKREFPDRNADDIEDVSPEK